MDVCPNCRAGTLHKRPVTYAAWHALSGQSDVQFIVAPVPARRCDVCGIKLFDEQALAWLMPLLGPAVKADLGSRLPFPRRGCETSSFESNRDQGRAQ
jgi:hypothetical protein